MKKAIFAAAAFAAAALSATSASAATNLVTNGSFESNNLSAGEKDWFADSAVTGWTTVANTLNFLASPGTAESSPYLPVYGPFAATSPDGGAFVMADAESAWRGAISQTLSGLVVGGLYAVNFYQAAGQQSGFSSPTTSQWQVTFGSSSATSDLMSLPEGGAGYWEGQSLLFTATSSTQVLSFLALGTPNAAPPVAFLDGVSVTAVPEPGTWAMMILGFGILGGVMRRRKASTKVALA